MQEESVVHTSAHQEQMNLMFANHSNEDMIYPLTVQEIAQAQKHDANLERWKTNIQHNWSKIQKPYMQGWKMVNPVAHQHRAGSWYHHYLQHPRCSQLD